MNEFLINLVPSVTPGAWLTAPVRFDQLNVSHIQAVYPQEHRIDYMVNGRLFTYYPAPILIILGDLHLEWELVRKREDHMMTQSGYTVLRLEFKGEVARLFNPAMRDRDERGESLGDFSAQDMESKFFQATSDVWGLISGL